MAAVEVSVTYMVAVVPLDNKLSLLDRYAVKVAGLQPHLMSLDQDTLLPDFSRIDAATAARCTCLLLNYPNNPTGVVVDDHFWQQVLQFCKQHDLLLIHDNPYVGQVWISSGTNLNHTVATAVF